MIDEYEIREIIGMTVRPNAKQSTTSTLVAKELGAFVSINLDGMKCSLSLHEARRFAYNILRIAGRVERRAKITDGAPSASTTDADRDPGLTQ